MTEGERSFQDLDSRPVAQNEDQVASPVPSDNTDSGVVDRFSNIRALGHNEIEEVLCHTSAFGQLDSLLTRDPRAWQIEFPGLPTLPGGEKKSCALRICIATEDIVGPVRNGGIGTTYAFLAEMLADQGIDTTILYLRGQDAENGSIEQWIDHYGRKGIAFVPVPNYAAVDRFRTGVNALLHASYNMMRYLLDHPMDVVHVSEWRGSGYLSLLAKRQGLAFGKVLFIVKASSPWLWNRLYGSQPVDRADDLTRFYAERQSIELADIVIGGSTHLLRWMGTQGYKLPQGRTFVQPNVVFFHHLGDLADKRKDLRGKRIPIEEFVFFGRLESRKGLFIFCEAIKRLIHSGVPLPSKITFMGKQGARLTARPDEDVVDFIAAETANWPCEVALLTEFHQAEALAYLLSGNRLAVMPSVVENSSLAVYEATLFGVPFIASEAGGTPELVSEADRPSVLCAPHPIPLSERLAEALEIGGFVGTPSFDNDLNLARWRQFHADLGQGLQEDLLAKARIDVPSRERPTIAVCIYHPFATDALERTLDSLQNQDVKPEEVLVGFDNDDLSPTVTARLAERCNIRLRFIDCRSFDAGLAFNMLAKQSSAQYLLFTWSGMSLRDRALHALAGTAQASRADVLNFFHRVVQNDDETESEFLNASILGSVSEAFFRFDLAPMPLLVRASAFDKVGGFSTDYRVLGCEQEFVARCQVQGLSCTTALLDMGTVPAWDATWLRQRSYDEPVSYFRAIRPQIAAAPLALRELLLLAKGLQARLVARRATSIRQRSRLTTSRRSFANRAFDKLFNSLISDSQLARSKVAAPAAQGPQRSNGTGHAATPSTKQRVPPSQPHRQTFHIGRDASDSYSGRLLAVKGRQLVGWIRSDTKAENAVDVVLHLNGRQTKSVRANRRFDPPTFSAAAVAGHAFVFDVGQSIWLRHRIAGPIDAALKISGTDIILAETTIGYRSLKDAGFEGHCDLASPGVIDGWAWKIGEPFRTVEVAIFVDDAFVARLSCGRERDDVRSAGKGSGNYGFSFTVPRAFRDGKRRMVEVVLADHGIHLPRGRIILKGNDLRFA